MLPTQKVSGVYKILKGERGKKKYGEYERNEWGKVDNNDTGERVCTNKNNKTRGTIIPGLISL
jgi:hypothetical protein